MILNINLNDNFKNHLLKSNIMKQCVTGVDIGTGSTKAVAINTEGKVIAASQFYYSTNSPKPVIQNRILKSYGRHL